MKIVGCKNDAKRLLTLILMHFLACAKNNSAFQGGLRIVKVDLDNEELIKDKDGYCIEVSRVSIAPCNNNKKNHNSFISSSSLL
jgi:hypothetical protein